MKPGEMFAVSTSGRGESSGPVSSRAVIVTVTRVR